MMRVSENKIMSTVDCIGHILKGNLIFESSSSDVLAGTRLEGYINVCIFHCD